MTEIFANETLEPRPLRAGLSARLNPWLWEARALGALSMPLIVTQLAQMAMPTTDILMLGALSQDALAAAALATPIYIFAWLVGLGPASAIAPVVAHIVGANPSDRARTRIALRMAMWSVALLAAPLSGALFFAQPALIAFGLPVDLVRATAPYVHVLAIGLPFSLGFNVLRNFVTALGLPRTPLIVMFAAVLLNIALDYGLIFSRLGMPEIGLLGAAYATVGVQAFCFAAMLAVVTFAPRFRPYRVWRRFHRPDWARLGEIFRLGVSIGLTMIFETALFAISVLLMGHFGTSAVAAHQIAINIASNIFMVPLGIAMAATVRVGHAAGARNPQGVRRAGITALVMSAGFMLICAGALAIAPHAFIGLYLDPEIAANADAIAYGVSFLYVVAALQIFDGLQVVASFSLRGLKDVRIPMILAAVSYWGTGFPCALIFAFVVGWQGIGLWIGLAAGLALAAITLGARFLYLSAIKIHPAQ